MGKGEGMEGGGYKGVGKMCGYEGMGKEGEKRGWGRRVGMRGWGRRVEGGYRGWVQGQEYEAWAATVRWV